eukprot:10921143-Alexandrium_andersonii.AAC.1
MQAKGKNGRVPKAAPGPPIGAVRLIVLVTVPQRDASGSRIGPVSAAHPRRGPLGVRRHPLAGH